MFLRPIATLFLISINPESLKTEKTRSQTSFSNNSNQNQPSQKVHSLKKKSNSEPRLHLNPHSNNSCFQIERPNRQLYAFQGNVTLISHTTVPVQNNCSNNTMNNESSLLEVQNNTNTNTNFSFKNNIQINKIPLSENHLLLRGSQLRNTKGIIGCVIYTGMNSKIVKNSKSAPIKLSNVQKKTNALIFYMFIMLVVMSLFSIIGTMTCFKEEARHWYIKKYTRQMKREDQNLVEVNRPNLMNWEDEKADGRSAERNSYLTYVSIYSDASSSDSRLQNFLNKNFG